MINSPIHRRILAGILRVFFRLLYHEIAWSYDFVAYCVSLGRWNDWVKTVQPFIHGERVLELGHGPGHLQAELFHTGYAPTGVDRSFQMNRIARRRLEAGGNPAAIVRAESQRLPFPRGCFTTIVSTFPSEYIYNPETLAEVRRALIEHGRLIVLPAAWITSGDILSRIIAGVYRITGQVPTELAETAAQRLKEPFTRAGFQVSSEIIEFQGSQVLLFVATA